MHLVLKEAHRKVGFFVASKKATQAYWSADQWNMPSSKLPSGI